MQPVAIDDLLARYDLFLLDAYGVLVDASGALPGADAFLRRMRALGKDFMIVSNDASRSPASTRDRYRRYGLELELDQIMTSGLLLPDYFVQAGLVGARCIVLGTEDSREYVRRAGGIVTSPDDTKAVAVVVADDEGYPLLDTVNRVITVLLWRIERGEATALVLPNPDLIFPSAAGSFGIAAGAIAAMIEVVLRLRDGTGSQAFVPLGKPHAPLFEAAVRRFPDVDRKRIVMIGDQLGTDILGANRFGLDSVLVATGIARLGALSADEPRPTFTLLALDGRTN